MTPIALIRHGPTDWNEEHRLQGRADRSLSDEGREKVSTWAVPEVYKNFHWVASPLSRAQQTAALLALDIKHLEPAISNVPSAWALKTCTLAQSIFSGGLPTMLQSVAKDRAARMIP